jgi:ribosome-binding ATPase YchF (GTP1/OBG family)
VQVVRCFEDENVIHVSGKVDPVDDTDVINFELALADVAQVEKRLDRLKKGRSKTADEKARDVVETEALHLIMEGLENGKAARAVALNSDQMEVVRQLQLLTMKPLTYAANVAEEELAKPDANVHVQVRSATRACILCCRPFLASVFSAHRHRSCDFSCTGILHPTVTVFLTASDEACRQPCEEPCEATVILDAVSWSTLATWSHS